jgi:hypothetical protein
MDGRSADISQHSEPIPLPRDHVSRLTSMGRRRFALAGGLITLAAAGGYNLLSPRSSSTEQSTNIPATSPRIDTNKPQPVAPNAAPIEDRRILEPTRTDQLKQHLPKVEQTQKLKKFTQVIDLFWSKYPTKESITVAKDKIMDKYKLLLSNAEDTKASADRTLHTKYFIDGAVLEQKDIANTVIVEMCKAMEIPYDEQLTQVFLALEMQESSGNPDAISPKDGDMIVVDAKRAGETGISKGKDGKYYREKSPMEKLDDPKNRHFGAFQMKTSSADERFQNLKSIAPDIYKKVDNLRPKEFRGKPITSRDLMDGRISMYLASGHLISLVGQLEDTGLAIWTYHFGIGNMLSIVQKFAEIQAFKDPQPDKKLKEIDKAFKDHQGKAMLKYIREYNINSLSLQDNQDIIGLIMNRGADQDQTYDYTNYIMAKHAYLYGMDKSVLAKN